MINVPITEKVLNFLRLLLVLSTIILLDLVPLALWVLPCLPLVSLLQEKLDLADLHKMEVGTCWALIPA